MIKRIKPSDSIIDELEGNGYVGFLSDQVPWDLIDEMDSYLEEVISKQTIINKTMVKKKLEEIIIGGISCNIDSDSVDSMNDFIMHKLERYIESGFSQSYKSLDSSKYFSHCSEQFKPSEEFRKVINEALKYLKQKALDTDQFEQLILNFGVDHMISKEVNSFAKKLIYKETGEVKEIRIGGQIKLHPPKISDIDSINWHFDGDPRFIKVLCYLEDQPQPDGSFSIRNNITNEKYLGSHIKTIIQSININESRKRINSIRVHDMGIFLLNSHMPILHKRALNSDDLSDRKYEIYTPKKFRFIMFKGVECLHRGGNNRHYCRPVFQGIAACT